MQSISIVWEQPIIIMLIKGEGARDTGAFSSFRHHWLDDVQNMRIWELPKSRGSVISVGIIRMLIARTIHVVSMRQKPDRVPGHVCPMTINGEAFAAYAWFFLYLWHRNKADRARTVFASILIKDCLRNEKGRKCWKVVIMHKRIINN